MFKELKELKQLKLKIKVFEDLTGVSFESWFRNLGNLEHNYHSKLQELNIKEAELKVKEELLNDKLEAVKAKVIGEKEEKYHHDLHMYVQEITNKHFDLMTKLAETLKQNIEVNQNVEKKA